jgi:hypothetical protein
MRTSTVYGACPPPTGSRREPHFRVGILRSRETPLQSRHAGTLLLAGEALIRAPPKADPKGPPLQVFESRKARTIEIVAVGFSSMTQ